MTAAFWILFSLIIYCYIGYPFLLFIISLIRKKSVKREEWNPSVSIILSAYNEESVIEKKILNCLQINYPKDKIEILAGSDGSTDNTAKILKGFSDKRIRTFDSETRRGKTAMLNRLVKESSSDILIFTDAAELFKPDSVSNLIRNLADKKTGCVSGCYLEDPEGGTFSGAGLYWRYEVLIRKLESRVNTLLGASGQIYAIRRELYVPQPDDTILDDQCIPQEVLRKGYRIVFEKEAVAYGTSVKSTRKEFLRKRRTLQGNFQALARFGDLLLPILSFRFFQIFSHKILRLLVPWFMAGIFIISLLKITEPFFFYLLYGQTLFYLFAFAGYLFDRINFRPGLAAPVLFPYHIVSMNLAAVLGFVDFLRNKKSVLWQRVTPGE